MEIRCVKGMYRLKLVSSEKKFKQCSSIPNQEEFPTCCNVLCHETNHRFISNCGSIKRLKSSSNVS